MKAQKVKHTFNVIINHGDLLNFMQNRFISRFTSKPFALMSVQYIIMVDFSTKTFFFSQFDLHTEFIRIFTSTLYFDNVRRHNRNDFQIHRRTQTNQSHQTIFLK